MPLGNFLRSCSELFQNYEEYRRKDELIRRVIHAPNTDDSFLQIYHKVVLIDSLYFTRLNRPNPFEMAIRISHIPNLNERLNSGDPEVVENIRRVHPNTSRGQYSFATKYACWHNHSAYPIFDSIVHALLPALNQCYSFDPNMRPENSFLEDYGNLMNAINCLINFISTEWTITDERYKRIDEALWLFGKYLEAERNDPSLLVEIEEQAEIEQIDRCNIQEQFTAYRRRLGSYKT